MTSQKWSGVRQTDLPLVIKDRCQARVAASVRSGMLPSMRMLERFLPTISSSEEAGVETMRLQSPLPLFIRDWKAYLWKLPLFEASGRESSLASLALDQPPESVRSFPPCWGG